jgi:hypothetical protein
LVYTNTTGYENGALFILRERSEKFSAFGFEQ